MATVLIIDDDQDVTRLLQAHLTEEGHSVIVTHDGKEGMTQLLRGTPDLIMLDVFLPDATGYQMCNRIRMNEATKTTPIIMMTGAARFPNQQMYGRQRGANEYIFKPFDIVEVGDLVHKYISPAADGTLAPSQDTIAVTNAYLQKIQGNSNGNPAGGVINMNPQIQEPIEPLVNFGNIFLEPKAPAMNGNGTHAYAEPAPTPESAPEPVLMPASVPPAPIPAPGKSPVSREKFIAPSLGSKERFLEFSLDIFTLATHLCSTHAEKYLADQLLRTSLSVGAKLNAASYATSASEFSSLTAGALHHLREVGYWLMLTRKTGNLEKLSKTDLEKTCQSLTTLLTDYVNDKKNV